MPYAPRTLDLKSKRLSVEPFKRLRFPLAIRSWSASGSTTATSFNCSNNQVAQTRRLGVQAGTSRQVTSPEGAPRTTRSTSLCDAGVRSMGSDCCQASLERLNRDDHPRPANGHRQLTRTVRAIAD